MCQPGVPNSQLGVEDFGRHVDVLNLVWGINVWRCKVKFVALFGVPLVLSLSVHFKAKCRRNNVMQKPETIRACARLPYHLWCTKEKRHPAMLDTTPPPGKLEGNSGFGATCSS